MKSWKIIITREIHHKFYEIHKNGSFLFVNVFECGFCSVSEIAVWK